MCSNSAIPLMSVRTLDLASVDWGSTILVYTILCLPAPVLFVHMCTCQCSDKCIEDLCLLAACSAVRTWLSIHMNIH